MESKTYVDTMKAREVYQNHWHSGLMETVGADPCYCCFALLCPLCASCHLRKRALYGQMSRYRCCGGYMACGACCGECCCPKCCLCIETQHNIEMDQRRWQSAMEPPPLQQMSGTDQPVPAPSAGYPSPTGGYHPAAAYAPTPQSQVYPPAGFPPPQPYSPVGYHPTAAYAPTPQSQVYPPAANPQPQPYPPAGYHPTAAHAPTPQTQVYPPAAYPRPQPYPPAGYPPAGYPR